MKSRIPRTLTAVALGVAATLAVAQPTGAARPAAATAAVGPYVKVGYFTQWGIYRRNFLVKNLHTSAIAGKVTHINYAFGNVGVDGRCFEANESGQGDAWADYQKRFRASESVDGVADVVSQPLAGNFNQLRKLKAMYPGLQVQMSLGGWTWSKYFSDAALTPASRQAFVPPASTCSSRATCRSSVPPRMAGPAAAPVSSTASTSTGSGRPPRATPATWCVPRTSRTSPRCSPSSAASSTTTARAPGGGTR